MVQGSGSLLYATSPRMVTCSQLKTGTSVRLMTRAIEPCILKICATISKTSLENGKVLTPRITTGGWFTKLDSSIFLPCARAANVVSIRPNFGCRYFWSSNLLSHSLHDAFLMPFKDCSPVRLAILGFVQ